MDHWNGFQFFMPVRAVIVSMVDLFFSKNSTIISIELLDREDLPRRATLARRPFEKGYKSCTGRSPLKYLQKVPLETASIGTCAKKSTTRDD